MEKQVLFDDPLLYPHLTKMTQFIQSQSFNNQSITSISNIVKQTNPLIRQPQTPLLRCSPESKKHCLKAVDCEIQNF